MLKAAYFHSSIAEFVKQDVEKILGLLTREHGFTLETQQRDAWSEQIFILQDTLTGFDQGDIFFEFAVPRIGKRADVVLVFRHAVAVVEFKIGAVAFDRGSIEQVIDYSLDLKNFHEGSHSAAIVPILCSTEAEGPESVILRWSADDVASPLLCGRWGLAAALEAVAATERALQIDIVHWTSSKYKPTPTIVEAAQALYSTHKVADITRSDAAAKNLSVTSAEVEAIIEHSKETGEKAICFVTGVPGAGKTLVGLNIATARADRDAQEHAVYLSGNGPLVTVLREALARDEHRRTGVKKSDASRKVSSFIQNIHHFRDQALREAGAPTERIVIFDEAQRAWTLAQTAAFMKAKRNHPDFAMSEPEFLISIMDRHDSWCVIVCLVGGGQEINTGEAGITEWINSLERRFPNWNIYVSEQLSGEDYAAPGLITDADRGFRWRDELHLSVSMRSFRAESLSSCIGHVVNNRPDLAAETYEAIRDRYPIVLTRNLNSARAWLRSRSRGSERFGLLASSGASRLRPEGIHIKSGIDPALWFLNSRDDVRSSYYCEDVATEFDVQGLELDWAGVCWDADFRYEGDAWGSFDFKGAKWQKVRAPSAQTFLKNAYRVILTRARQGMIIFVPTGEAQDATRPPAFYDSTFAYLKRCGIRELPDNG